jgi:hypothetical protein
MDLFLEAPDGPVASLLARGERRGSFFLELDGLNCGALASVEGGEAVADVVRDQSGTEYFLKKHLTGFRYEAFSVKIGLSLNKPAYDWIAAAWAAHPLQKNGAVISADRQHMAKARRAFTDAHIFETIIPVLDASSKDEALLTLKIAPRLVRSEKTEGKVLYVPGEPKKWLAGNFRLEIDDLDCTKVNVLDSFTVTRQNSGKIDFPNLRITLPETNAATWVAWHEDFVVKGNNDESQEKEGSLTFLSTELQPLGRINFFNLGIFRLASQQADEIRRVRADLYCERMEFSFVQLS